jgi:hypothetical protein
LVTELKFVGAGIYALPEAAKLTGVSTQRIARWIRGYEHGPQGERRFSPRIWNSDLPAIDGSLALSFRDLMEVRFVAAFREAGLSWPTLRAAHATACRMFHSDHPFSTDKFRTDGRQVFLDLEPHQDEAGVIEIRTRQHYFEEIIRPMFKDLDVAGDQLLRWWPLGRERNVLLDPERSFGAPIVREGVATRLIAWANLVNSQAEISRWYEISSASVRDAIAFEKTQRRKPAA